MDPGVEFIILLVLVLVLKINNMFNLIFNMGSFLFEPKEKYYLEA